MILPAHRKQARLAIHRLGELATVLAPGATAVDDYGKVREVGNWSSAAEERIVVTYTRSERPAQARHSGGRYRTESPTLVFRDDSVIEEGFRVQFPDGREYEVDAITDYPTHSEGSTTVIN